MKRAVSCALFFGVLTLFGSEVVLANGDGTRRTVRQAQLEQGEGERRVTKVRVRQVTRETRETRRMAPPPVAERVSEASLANPRTSVEGVVPRVLTAPDPVQMINPLAPPEYGSGRNLVTYTERDPYRTTNENKLQFQPDGIRLLTLRPLW